MSNKQESGNALYCLCNVNNSKKKAQDTFKCENHGKITVFICKVCSYHDKKICPICQDEQIPLYPQIEIQQFTREQHFNVHLKFNYALSLTLYAQSENNQVKDYQLPSINLSDYQQLRVNFKRRSDEDEKKQEKKNIFEGIPSLCFDMESGAWQYSRIRTHQFLITGGFIQESVIKDNKEEEEKTGQHFKFSISRQTLLLDIKNSDPPQFDFIQQIKGKPLEQMNIERVGHSQIYHDASDSVFVIGGNNDEKFLNECERYDILQNQWSFIQPMETPRSRATAVVIDDKIYVFGGFRCRNKSSCVCKEKQQCTIYNCEIYSIVLNTWETFNYKKYMKTIPTVSCSSVQINKNIYLIGGVEHKKDNNQQASKIIYQIKVNQQKKLIEFEDFCNLTEERISPAIIVNHQKPYNSAYNGEDEIIIFGGSLIPSFEHLTIKSEIQLSYVQENNNQQQQSSTNNNQIKIKYNIPRYVSKGQVTIKQQISLQQLDVCEQQSIDYEISFRNNNFIAFC